MALTALRSGVVQGPVLAERGRKPSEALSAAPIPWRRQPLPAVPRRQLRRRTSELARQCGGPVSALAAVGRSTAGSTRRLEPGLGVGGGGRKSRGGACFRGGELGGGAPSRGAV